MYTAFSEESRLISSGWKERPGAAPMYTAYSGESANLIGLEGAAKFIRDELGARYNKMESVIHLGTDCVGVGSAELESRRILGESRRILGESTTDVIESAELFNHRIGVTNTALD